MIEIPLFPKFRILEFTDKEEIERIYSSIKPYSDYNFLCLWSWNIYLPIQISKLNSSIVIQQSDFITEQVYLSILSENSIENELKIICKKYQEDKISVFFKCITEEHILKLSQNEFCIIEDRGNFDYIFETRKIIEYKGFEYRTLRRKLNQFKKNTKKVELKISQLKNCTKLEPIIKFFQQSNQEIDRAQSNELKALKNLIKYFKNENILLFTISQNNQIIAFAIVQTKTPNYSFIPFIKASRKTKGTFHFLMYSIAQHLFSLDIQFINFESDMDNENIRLTKSSFRPVFFLKKYIITTHKSS